MFIGDPSTILEEYEKFTFLLIQFDPWIHAYCFQFFRADEHVLQSERKKTNIYVPIVFSFFARMNHPLCRLFWDTRSRAYCFQVFRADEPLDWPPRGFHFCVGAYCFQFFRADERSCLRKLLKKELRAYCFQFFRADELIVASNTWSAKNQKT